MGKSGKSSGLSDMTGSDAVSGASSGNESNENGHNNDDEDFNDVQDANDQSGNGEIIKTINEIFTEVNDAMMDDAYVRIKYLKKLNKKTDKDDAELVDEIGIQ